MTRLAEIPRIKAGAALASTTEINEMSGERSRLAVRAADLLGYHTLANHLSGKTVTASETGKLTETLRSLGFDVLETSAVISYQLDEATRLTKEKIADSFHDWTSGYFSPAQWHHVGLSDYEKPVPEFVLDKAVRLKEALPEVQFRVHFLSEPKADPFLIAVLGKEIYYLEAWDEPRFEQTL
jgi:hypothetical protein